MLNMRLYAALLIFLLPLLGHTQNQGNVWVFGNNNKLDFNTLPPTVGGSAMNLIDQEMEGSASICDSSGQLLFYSDGRRLWDWNNQEITDTLRGHQSAMNSAYVVPRPEHANEYFLITVDSHRNQLQNGLRYTRVIACREEGVSVAEVNVLLAENMTEKITAVRHHNGVDYWLITHDFGNNQFRVFLLSETGIQFSAVYNAGISHGTSQSDYDAVVGAMKASPQGNLIVATITNPPSKTDVVSFNKQDGVIAELVSFVSDTLEGFAVGAYGLSFSPNGDFLYLASTYDQRVFQFNVSLLPNVQSFLNSRELVYTFSDGNQTPSFQNLQLSVDGMIYLSNFTDYLAVIESPNSQGVACSLQDSVIQLLNSGIYGLPAFIDSYDYTISGVCDTGVGINEQTNSQAIDVYPNPTSGELRLVLPTTVKATNVVVYDMLGNQAVEMAYQPMVDVSALPKGNYIIAVLTEENTYRQLLVVE